MKNLIKTILLIGSIILTITGCTNNPPLKSNPNVPKVKELRSLSDRNAIGLEWDIVNKPNIAGYYIQRSENAKKYTTITKIDNKYVAHFTDTNLKPNSVYYYKISTFTKKGIPSFARLKKVKTLPTISPISFIANSGLKVKGMIKIIFRPHQNERVEGYYVEKFNNKTAKWEVIANLKPRLRAEFIDNKNLIDGQIYKYRIIAYTFDGLKSLPSKEVTIKTLSKPAVITNLSATTNLPKKIKLHWQKIPGAVKYKIYSSSIDMGYKYIGATTKNSYTDLINEDGVNRFYKVSSVDKYGIESLKSAPVMGSTLNKPAKPIVSIDTTNNSIVFTLSSPDKRAIKYLIVKNDGERIVKIHNVKSKYTDNNVKHNKTYEYKIYAIDKNGLISKASKLEVNF